MELKLMVSQDAGGSYHEEARAEDKEPLLARAKEMRLDEQMLRWVIETDDGSDIVEFSAIHRGIVGFLYGDEGLSVLDEARKAPGA